MEAATKRKKEGRETGKKSFFFLNKAEKNVYSFTGRRHELVNYHAPQNVYVCLLVYFSRFPCE